MQHINVAAVSLNLTPLDWAGIDRLIRRELAHAIRCHVQVVCFPELCLTGYGCEDIFLSDWIYDRALQMLGELIPATKGIIATFGLPLKVGESRYNGVAVVADGRLHGFVLKQHLAGRDVYYEPRWFSPWPPSERTTVTVRLPSGSQEVPVGDLFFEFDGIRIGVEICEDAWVKERKARHLSQWGIDLILNPSASHFAFGKHEVRRAICETGSQLARIGYVYTNLLGCESGRLIFDGDCIIASQGVTVATSRMLSFRESLMVGVTLPIPPRPQSPTSTTSLDGLIVVSGVLHDLPAVVRDTMTGPAPWQSSDDRKEEEFLRAVALGLFDYMRKSRLNGFVVSLSGGADSSAVTSLVALMVHLALAELGMEELCQRLAYFKRFIDAASHGTCALIAETLACAFQGTRNNSPETRSAARTLAAELGATFFELEVDDLVERYTALAEGAWGRPLSWESDDLALQNIQARVRAPGIWFIANLRGALLLSTSNRSEASVGYATMDGDTSGGLAPIAGIDKASLRIWLRWLATKGPQEYGPVRALGKVIANTPGPELRPPTANQTGEGDLMPYDVLDAIERAAIRDRLPPREVTLRIAKLFPAHPYAPIVDWVRKFFRLWTRNQWKRERYAPSFHLDDENVDPKTWCRFPIISSGFTEELAAIPENAPIPEDG